MKTNRKYYVIITLYILALVVSLITFNHMYASRIDWISQHSVIPEYFRNLFYETKRLIPNFAFNIGAGQNIYNFSYYGLLSPIILISYLLPFVPMTIYIQIASIVLYVLFGLLIFKFINNNFKNSFLSFICSIFVVTFSAVNFNFHHHIMFVWYLPFLVISLIGVDKYFKSGKSWLFILGAFLIIMTNYYYSVSSLIVIFCYGLFRILNEIKEFKLSVIIKKVFIFGLHLIIPVMMGMVIILPTYACLKGLDRSSHDVLSLWQLFIPQFKNVFYLSGGLGIVGMFFLAPIGNLFRNKNRLGDIFLNVVLIVIITIPLFMYILNGMLYVRSKVLIPFIPLYIYSFASFSDSLFRKEIEIEKFVVFVVGVLIVSLCLNFENWLYCVALLFTLAFVYISYKKKNKKLFYGYTFISIFACLLLTNSFENYISKDFYDKIYSREINELYDGVVDTDYYRSYNKFSPKDDANKVYNKNYYSPMMYSSTYNKKYWEFYNFRFGNNIKYRNTFMMTGTDNELFYTYMGVRYLTSKAFEGSYYKEVKKGREYSLYYNEDAYPICYVPEKLGSYKELKSLDFPYDLEYLMKRGVVLKEGKSKEKSDIHEYKSGELEEKYEFRVRKEKVRKKIKIDDIFKGKILYLSFDMMENEECSKDDIGDAYISINGVKNKLTCKDGIYHNKNNKFQYVLPISMEDEELKVEIGEGKYRIENVHIYYSDKIIGNNKAMEKIEIDKRNSVIRGEVNITEDNYLITTIPYDEGFKVFVNDREVETEIVNEAFLGAKLKSGKNQIRIEYEAPYFKCSVFVSLIGGVLFFLVLLYEGKYKKRFRKLEA